MCRFIACRVPEFGLFLTWGDRQGAAAQLARTGSSSLSSPAQPDVTRGGGSSERRARALESGQLAKLRPMLPDEVRMDSGMSAH